jgi:hypothetical protein
MNTLLQRPNFFELQAIGPEDVEGARLAEALLNNDLRQNRFPLLLWQWLLSVAVFGVGIFKIIYTRRYATQFVKQQIPPTTFGNNIVGLPSEEIVPMKRLEFIGNMLEVISPYDFYPDPNYSLSDFQKGEFVASDTWYGRHQLRLLEANGEIAGLDFVGSFRETDELVRRRREVSEIFPTTSQLKHSKQYQITEVQLNLIPSDFMVDNQPLGPETEPQKWVVWIANNQRIIKAEPLGYLHDKFTYALAEIYPDLLRIAGDSLAGTISSLQDLASWFVNSHMTNVRKVIGDKLIVKPSLVEVEDLRQRRSVIRLKEEANDIPISDVIQQLGVADVTKGHVQDADWFIQLAQLTTGLTENAMGSFYTGRRSAREAATVANSIASRIRMPAMQMFTSCFEPMAKQMLMNHQQGLDVEVIVRIVGEEQQSGLLSFARASREKIIGNFDFVPVDATTPGERVGLSVALGEFMTSIPGGLQTLLSLGYDPRKFVEEWLILLGFRHPKRFLLDEERAKQLVQQITATQILYGNGQPRPPNGGQEAPGGQAGAS